MVIDQKALDDVGVGTDGPIGRPALCGPGKMSVRSYIEWCLRQQNLVLIEEKHRLLITSAEQAGNHLSNRVLPVADLLYTDRVADPSLLWFPYMDHDDAARERIREKLRRPMSLNVKSVALYDVLRQFSGQLGENVVIDRKALDDVGMKWDVPVDAQWRAVPAGESLRWVLEQIHLDYYVRGDLIVISSPEETENRLEVRLHSVRGLVAEAMVEDQTGTTVDGWGGMGAMGGAGGKGHRPAMGGGMGGMGFSGMGGMGGGMGGMGMGGAGGMGGMGGGFFGGPPASRPAATASPAADLPPENVSLVRDPQSAEEPAEEPANTPSPALRGSRSGLPTRIQYDFDSLMDQITGTIQPNTWDDVGGAGSIAPFWPTGDLVFAQTQRVHDDVEELIAELRKLPWEPAAGGHGPRAGAVPSGPPDPETLVDTLTSTIQANSWDEVGGAGSIAFHWPQMALVVSQTQEMQDEIMALLTRLRRSRYVALRGQRPWESAIMARTAPLSIAGQVPGGLRLASYPAASPEGLKLLAARRDADGAWTWRRTTKRDGQEQIALRRSGQRREVAWLGATARLEAEQAAIAYPGLTLVELGEHAELLCRTLDVQMPWMPHRTNDELARLFAIEAAGNEGGTVRLRLRPRDIEEQPDTYLLIGFADGRPVLWESYLQGKRTARLRFENDGARVVMEDAGGAELARWERVEQGKPAAIAELTAGWENCVQLDRRDNPREDLDFREALRLLGRRDWRGAAAGLRKVEKLHPGNPLVLLLLAWCIQQDAGAGEPAEAFSLLKQVGASQASDLKRFIVTGRFPSLEPKQRYEILLAQAEDRRTAADQLWLARAATDAGLFVEGLQHVQLALKVAGPDQLAAERLRMELLACLGRNDDLRTQAAELVKRSDVGPAQLAPLAEALARRSKQDLADELFGRALQGALPADERCDLLLRQAATHDGTRRWELLLQAAEAVSADSYRRSRALALLLDEWKTPDRAADAGALAAKASDIELRAVLLLAQAEITNRPAVAGDALWQLQQIHRLPEDRLEWVFDRWVQAGQGARAIEVAEAMFRRGKRLNVAVLDQLVLAYRAAGRDADALRATSEIWDQAWKATVTPVRAPTGGGMF